MFDLNKSGEENLVDHINAVNDLKNRVGQDLTVAEASFYNVQPFGGNPGYNTQIMVDTRNPLVFGKGEVRLYYQRIDLRVVGQSVMLPEDSSAKNVSDYLAAFNAATELKLTANDIIDAPIGNGPVIIVTRADNLIYTGNAVLNFLVADVDLSTALAQKVLSGLVGP